MKFLLLVIDLIMYAICKVHAYFDLISLPLSYLNSSHLSFLMQVWVFIQQFRHMRGGIYFRTAKFWENISDYLIIINRVYIDFAHGLYSIGALRPIYTKKCSKEENIVSGPRLFYFGKLKVFVWNGVGSRGWGDH